MLTLLINDETRYYQIDADPVKKLTLLSLFFRKKH